MLKLENLSSHYGTVQALSDVNLYVDEGEIVTLIGANGAGKTTLLRVISGLVRPSRGQVVFADQRIDQLPPDEIVRMGIAHVPEGRMVFPAFTVRENLLIGGVNRLDQGRPREEVEAEMQQDLQAIFKLFPRLEERISQYGWSLSGGEQQMLAIGRGLMARPKLLLLDEPSLGLAPFLVKEVFSIIETIREQGTSVLLVEQNARMALRVADRAYVLETGSIVLEGPAKALLHADEVRKAYLGG
ncbi:MAG: ABC transporter ATP-binding protein [Firmicutes bacterium]|nr:ABC transporter ATP-binding protein [Bacillota bacterium]